MKNIRGFLSENFQFSEINFSIYLNRRVFVMHVNILISETQNPTFLLYKEANWGEGVGSENPEIPLFIYKRVNLSLGFVLFLIKEACVSMVVFKTLAIK